MLQFVWPWLFLILPAPWLLGLVLPPSGDPSGAALRVPFLDELPQRGTATAPRNPIARLALAWLAWLLLVTAAARPQWLGEPIEQTVSGRDLLLAVDLSGSMEMEDFVLSGRPVDRLTATKAVAGEFIERRAGDRIGLILFGERAYLQAPLTFDRKTVRTLLDEGIDTIPPNLCTTIYRVAQEAITNARKHAFAEQVTLELRRVAGAVHMTIGDHGCGFDVEEARHRGFGLMGMAERVRLAGGEFSIESRPGTGTCVNVTLPVALPSQVEDD